MQNSVNKHSHKDNVHVVLAHSYTIYFALFLIGIYLDLYFKFRIFTGPMMVSAGVFFLVFASVVILWAQKTGRDLRKIKEIKKEHFCRGPYCYTRIPTQWGLLFLVLGFGIITNSLFIIIATIISFFISKFVFLDRQEKILADKYGVPYLEYKKIVKF